MAPGVHEGICSEHSRESEGWGKAGEGCVVAYWPSGGPRPGEPAAEDK